MKPGGCEHLSVLEKARRLLRRRALGGEKGLREALLGSLGGSSPLPRAEESQGERPSRAPLEHLTYDCEDAAVPIPEDPFMIMGESLLDEIVKGCSKEVQIFLTQPTSATSGLLTAAGKGTPPATRVSNISDESRRIPKTLHGEITSKRDKVEKAFKDAEVCSEATKDYELQASAYSSGSETSPNIPSKRNLVQSPSGLILQEAAEIQSRYIELLTRSGGYYKFSSKMLNFLSEMLKMKNTKIELLEEELRLARGANSDNSNKHKFLAQKKITEEREYKIERLRVLLQDEGTWNREYEKELVKERNQLNEEMSNVKKKYETEIKTTAIQQIASQKVEDAKSLRVQIERLQRENRDLKDEIVMGNNVILETTEEQRRAEENAPQRKACGPEVAQRKQHLELELKQVLQLRHEDNVRSKQVLEDAAMIIPDKIKKVRRLKIQLREEARGRRELENELAKVKNNYDEEVISLKNKYETEINISKTTINEVTARKEEEADNYRAQLDNVVRENKSLCEEIRRLENTLSQTTENLRQAEESVRQLKAVDSEISQKKQHLATELKQTVKKYAKETIRYEQLLDNVEETIAEKNKEIAKLRKMLQAETNQRKSMEEENIQLQRIQFGLQKVDINATETISRLKGQEQELGRLKSEYEILSQEKKGKDQDNTRLQSTMQERKHQKSKLQEELNRQRGAITEEVSKREKVEEELESMRRSSREQAVKITNLPQPTEEVSIVKERSEDDLKHRREMLDNHLADKESCMAEIRKHTSEIETLRHQLVQEQDNLRQARLLNEHLQELIEEKSKNFDECKIQIKGLQSLTENLTKEPLMSDEESCHLRSDCDDLRRSRSEVDGGENATIIELKNQLQTTTKHALELQSQISGLQTERENLRQEIGKYQKQALEVFTNI